MEHKTLNKLGKNGKAGDWCFINNDTQVALRYGDDAFKDMVILPISKSFSERSWLWNGSKDEPTLTPSILVKEYPNWTKGGHWYFTCGKLISV